MKPKGVLFWSGVRYNATAPLIFVKAGVKIDTDILESVEQWALQRYGTDAESYWNHLDVPGKTEFPPPPPVFSIKLAVTLESSSSS